MGERGAFPVFRIGVSIFLTVTRVLDRSADVSASFTMEKSYSIDPGRSNYANAGESVGGAE